MDFEPIDHDTFDYVGNYFDLKDSLEQLFNRKVDLIEYGKTSIQSSRHWLIRKNS